MWELFHISNKEADLYCEINNEIEVNKDWFKAVQYKIVGKEDRCRDHAKCNGQSICSLHVCSLLKMKYDADATEIENEVNSRYKKLASCFGRINDPQFRPEVQSHRLADQRKRSGNEG